MADRSDITYIQTLSPRVAQIAAPSTEIVMQDYVDTTRLVEDDFVSMGYPKLINASGKEDLGGGTKVAVTVEEQNLQLAFEPRFTPAVTGTVTTASGPPNSVGRITFEDSAADFIAAGVLPGSYIINWTDRSVTDVVRVVDATMLETRTLVNGTDNEFDLADDYSLWNITQVRTSGGNLVAVDENGSSIPAILPTWGTQVVLTTSSSATIQELEDIQFSSFNGGVTIDTVNGQAGTLFPAGTLRQPVDNLDDALTIANARGFDTFYLFDDFTFAASDVVDGFIFEGRSAAKTVVTLTSAASITNCIFRMSTVTGDLDGGNDVSNCIVASLNYIDGTLLDSLITGTVTLGGAQANIIRCGSGVAGGGASQSPIIDMGGSGTDLVMRDWQGGVQLNNLTAGGDNISIDMSSGRVIIDTTVTDGLIYIRGIATVEDNGSGSVDTSGLLNQTTIAAAIWNALTATYSAAGSFGEFVGRRLLTVAKFFGLR